MSINPPIRNDLFTKIFPDEPSYRLQQMQQALFSSEPFLSWKDVTTLPKNIREKLDQEIPWTSYKTSQTLQSAKKDTYKSMLTLCHDANKIETVLMRNTRDQWTICVSSQVGCAMHCAFCATGKMGLTRNLTSDEIVDQYRFWKYFLQKHPELPQRISNVVFMGMGEPMANYDNVKATINTWLSSTDLGKTRITVSSVGVLPRLQKLLDDPDWPHVRLAISLHSADPKTRKEIVPTSYDAFLDTLFEWAKKYLEKYGNRRHHLTFEYVMLHGVNDTEHHAKVLAEFTNRIGNIRVNLIPYNFTDGTFTRSSDEDIQKFQQLLEKAGITVTQRKTMGEDIAAACGQLITLKKEKK